MSDNDISTAKPRALSGASAVLWVVTAALAVAAVVKLAWYPRFAEASSDACDAVAAQAPSAGWSDQSFPCEQFGPMGWYLPYWLGTLFFVVFAVLFLVAAIMAAKGRPGVWAFTLVIGIIAVAGAVAGLLDLGWSFAIESSNQADALVAERLRDALPVWPSIVESVVELVVIAGTALAVGLLSRLSTNAYLKQR
ncbi:MAG TPA: hypothetical protein VHG10_06940 [Glycomyces sp.]|nr:hypothetical protein [Glycomyces sp.]